MTLAVQIVRLAASHTARAAILNAQTGQVLAVLGQDSPPGEFHIHAGMSVLAVEVPEYISPNVGEIFPPMGGQSFTAGQALALSTEPRAHLLTDIDAVFRFGMGADVRIGDSQHIGIVDARSEHSDGIQRYLVKYRDEKGMPKSDWFDGGDLTHYDDGEGSVTSTADVAAALAG